MTTAATRKVSALRNSARSTSSTPGSSVCTSWPPMRRQHREDDRREHRGQPVGGDQGQLVGRLQLVLAQHVGDGGVLRRDPEQAERLDEELGDEQPDEVVDDRDGGEQPEPDDVGDHHRLAPVEPVGEGAGQRAEHDRRAAAGRAGRRRGRSWLAANPSTSEVAVAVIASRPEPVAEAGQRHRQPQLAEVADPQHGAQLGDQAHRRRRVARPPSSLRRPPARRGPARRRSSSVSGTAASRGTGVPAAAGRRPARSSARPARRARRAAAPGASGRTESGLPGSEEGCASGPWAGVTVPAGRGRFRQLSARKADEVRSRRGAAGCHRPGLGSNR